VAFEHQTVPVVLHLCRLHDRVIVDSHFRRIDLNRRVCMYLWLHEPFNDSPTLLQTAHRHLWEFRYGHGGIVSDHLFLSLNTIFTSHKHSGDRQIRSTTSLRHRVSHRAYCPSSSKSMPQHLNHLQHTLAVPLCLFRGLLGARTPYCRLLWVSSCALLRTLGAVLWCLLDIYSANKPFYISSVMFQDQTPWASLYKCCIRAP